MLKILENRTSARVIYNKDTLEILGLFYEWRKSNPDVLVMMQSPYRTFYIGDVVSLQKHDREAHKLLGLEETHRKMVSYSQKITKQKRDEAFKIANPILDECESDINAVLNKHGCHISYSFKGDTHGIHEEKQYIGIEINGFHFEREI